MKTFIFLTGMFLVGSAVHAQEQNYTGGNLSNEIEQVRALALISKSCTLASSKYDGFGVCFTGSPSMLEAEVACEGGKSVVIALEDPYYYFCPPAKLFNPNLGNGSVSEAHKRAWDALQSAAQSMRMSPYELFRLELIQTLNATGMDLKETKTSGIRSDLYGADTLSTFAR